MCPSVQERERAMGFGHFLTLSMVPTDKALLTVLMERWFPITQTFYLPVGEIGVPPIEFFMMTGLSMDRIPPLSSEEFDAPLVAWCIGLQPVVYYKGTKGVLPSWFENDYIWATDESSDMEKVYSIQAFLSYMLTHSIFCGKSDWVYCYLLPVLENLYLVATWSWGRSALGWMYLNMSEISMGQSPHAFVGLCFLWEVCVFFYFIFLLSFEFVVYLNIAFNSCLFCFCKCGAMSTSLP